MEIDNLQEILDDTFEELEFRKFLNIIAKNTLTEKGRELITSARPVTNNISQLKYELDMVEEMCLLLMADVPPPFENLHDIREIVSKSKIEGSVLSTDEIVQIANTLRVARLIKKFFVSKQEKYSLLANEINGVTENNVLQKIIANTIDESGNIKDNASKELHKIRIELAEKNNQLRHRMNKIVRNYSNENMTQDNFYTIRDGRFVLPVKSEHKRQIAGIIHGISQTGATVYLEPSEVIEINNDISILKNQEQNEIIKILKNITKEISKISTDLIESYNIIGHIDAIFAKAEYALEFGAIKPKILQSKEVIFHNVYHPLLVNNKGKKNVIPLSISFSEDKRGHLISGPNAGGKTVALKNIGINIIIVMSGFFTIGEIQTYPLNVFSAIGDHQSIENDLSTFSSQLLKIKQILDVADHNSLILIDEICSGTDPREGSALSAGILDTFIEIKLFFVVTTHQSSLKTYALNSRMYLNKNKEIITPAIIENDSFEFDESALKPTYNFLAGMPGNSYAFILAKNVGFSEKILSRAKKYLGNRQKQLEKSISILQKYKKETADTINEAKSEKLKYENIKKEYEEKKKELNEKKKNILDRSKVEASEILSKANSLVENTIKQIKEEKKSIAQIKQNFIQEKEKLDKEVEIIQHQKVAKEQNLVVVTSLNIGDYVGILDGSETGIVLEFNNIDKNALVSFNGIKYRLPYSQLFLKEKKKENKIEYIGTFTQPISFNLQQRLDLRGEYAEDALIKTTQFIEQAIVNNVEFVSIIHGKGTGVLRQTIHELLERTDGIKSFRLGDIYEGGSGVTLVYFR